MELIFDKPDNLCIIFTFLFKNKTEGTALQRNAEISKTYFLYEVYSGDHKKSTLFCHKKYRDWYENFFIMVIIFVIQAFVM